MNGKEYVKWLESPEGKSRGIHFGIIGACTVEDSVLYVETDEETAKSWKKEYDNSRYLRKIKEQSGYYEVPYQYVKSDDEEYVREETMAVEEYSLEEEVLSRINTELLYRALGTLNEKEMRLIYSVYLSSKPVTECEYGKISGICKSLVHKRKKAVLKRLRRYMENAGSTV